MEEKPDPQQQEIEVLLRVENCNTDNNGNIVNEFCDQTKGKNEKTTCGEPPAWSISEIAWYEAMVECCNDGSLNLESAGPTLTPGESAAFKGTNFEGKSERNTPVPCQGQGDGVDSPIFLCTPQKTKLEEFNHNKELPHHYTPITSIDKQPSEGAYRNTDPMSCINFETPRNFYSSVKQEFNTVNIRSKSLHHKKPYCGAPYTFPTYHPIRTRENVRQSLDYAKCRKALGPPHIARVTCISSNNTSGSSFATSVDSDLSSPPSTFDNSKDTDDKSDIPSDSSPVYPKVPNNTPESAECNVPTASDPAQFQRNQHLQLQPTLSSQLASRMWPNFSDSSMRESHNAKERFRRSRIRDACNNLRNAVPNVNERTDNATVFEEAYEYMVFLRDCSQSQYDEEFLQQSSSDKKRGG